MENNSKYESRGVVNIIDNGNNDTMEIVELPIKTWTQSYKEKVIEPYFDGSDKTAQILQDYKEYHDGQMRGFEQLTKVLGFGKAKIFWIYLKTLNHSIDMIDCY